jgi:tetraacyldisaccharide 4'-kinase
MKRATTSLLERGLLAVPACVYHAVQKTREELYAFGLLRAEDGGIPVVSVGNLLMGGSGKTPFVLYLAELFRNRGFRPAVVSRGYRGNYSEPYVVVSDGRSWKPLVEPEICGDEPYLLAARLRNVPVVVGRRRIHPVQVARDRFDSDLVLLDDGFQHLQLARDVDIVLINGTEDGMFPLGRLREPISALRRAHMIVLMGTEAVLPKGSSRFVGGKPLFQSLLSADSLILSDNPDEHPPPETFAGKAVCLVSGIANPERFRNTAEGLGWAVKYHWPFADHHVFSDEQLTQILREADGAPVVFTEKDWVKLPSWFKSKDQVAALRIRLSVTAEHAFWKELLGRLWN